MGYGTITGGGADGRYTISLDYGEETKTAYLAALNTQLEKLNADLLIAEAKLAEKQAEAQLVQDEINAATTSYIEAGGTGNAGAPAVQAALFFLEQQKKAYIEAQKLTIDARLKVEAIKLARAQALDYIVRWNAAVVSETKDAWCADLTEDGSGPVATIDINGESNLTLIAPGCRGWNANDGYMRAPDVMSPAGAYWNLAAAPGWQKWNPTYRWGTISSIDTDADTCTVNLASATSSQQSLGVNQSSTLSNVPVVYMTCNARAFEEGDRVVVQFIGQDWSNPRVIGFLDNPKPCLQYFASYYVIGYPPLSNGAQHLYALIDRYKDEEWEPYTIFEPSYPYRFIQWSDGNTSRTRDDGIATEDIARTARYTFAPNFKIEYEFVCFWSFWGDLNDDFVSRPARLSMRSKIKTRAMNASFTAEITTASQTPVERYLGEQIVWSGDVLIGVSPIDAFYHIMNENDEFVAPASPIYAPTYVNVGNTATFTLAGSANQYSVTGTEHSRFGTALSSSGRILDGYTEGDPGTGSSFGGVPIIVYYTASSWSAVYA